MEFDGKLKDFSQTEEVKLQMEEMRESFEIGGKEMFSDIMQKEKPKLGKRFSVDNRKLSKVSHTIVRASARPTRSRSPWRI